MTTEEKTKDEGKKEASFGFPFEVPPGMREMMKTWCEAGTGFCNCCPMTKMAKDEQST
ncbi:MAG: hypothetical protein AB1646_03380 [Thermodesulfobacteriota bacterium]